MKLSIKKGFSFGLISGTITTLGLIVGLNSGTDSKFVIISGILTIAIADAMSDALGIHISEESTNQHSTRGIWEATIATFLSKFIFALSFLIPIFLFQLSIAIRVCVVWGLGLIALFSYFAARQIKTKLFNAIIEHLGIAVIVIIITNYLGNWLLFFK